jgi:hypothetical protein
MTRLPAATACRCYASAKKVGHAISGTLSDVEME